MSSRVQSVGFNNLAFKGMVPRKRMSNIDKYYARELTEIRKQKQENDAFIKLNPESSMQHAKNQILIYWDALLRNKK